MKSAGIIHKPALFILLLLCPSLYCTTCIKRFIKLVVQSNFILSLLHDVVALLHQLRCE